MRGLDRVDYADDTGDAICSLVHGTAHQVDPSRKELVDI